MDTFNFPEGADETFDTVMATMERFATEVMPWCRDE